MDIQNKLEMFAQTVYGESMAERNRINDEIGKRSSESMDKCELEALTKAYERIHSARAEIERDYTQRLNSRSFEEKRSFIAFREGLVDGVFAEVEKKLGRFLDSEEYTLYLKRAVDEGKAMGKKLTAEVNAADKERFSQFLSQNGVAKINTAPIKGGIRIIVEDKGIVIDKSFDTALRDKRSSFNINQ